MHDHLHKIKSLKTSSLQSPVCRGRKNGGDLLPLLSAVIRRNHSEEPLDVDLICTTPSRAYLEGQPNSECVCMCSQAPQGCGEKRPLKPARHHPLQTTSVNIISHYLPQRSWRAAATAANIGTIQTRWSMTGQNDATS